MRKIILIAQREYAQVVKKKSFIIGILLTPALMAAFMLLPAWFAKKASDKEVPMVIVDQSGQSFGTQMANSLSQYKLDDNTNQRYLLKEIITLDVADSARYRYLYDSLSQAVVSHEIKCFLVIRPDAVRTPKDSIFVVANDEDFQLERQFEASTTRILSSQRLRESHISMSADSILKLLEPAEIGHRDTTGRAVDPQVKIFAAFTIVMIIYMMIVTYGQTVMRSVIDEKTSRIMEVMVSSVSPFQLMAGKLLGLGAAAFTQVAIWIALGVVMLGFSSFMAIHIDPSIMRVVFNPMLVVFFTLFLVGGYFLYSAMFALLGSIVNSDKEAQNFLMPIVLMLVLPVMIGMYILQDPNSALAISLSLIPFFSPTMMVMRIAVVAPTATSLSPFSGILGQALLSFGILILGILGMIWLCGRIFRVGILMYGKRPTLPEIVKWVRY